MAKQRLRNKTKSEAVPRARARKWLYCGTAVVVIVLIVSAPRMFHRFAEAMARKNLNNHKAEIALRWLRRAGGADSTRPATLFLLGRTHRKQDHVDQATLCLELAEKAGYPSEAVQRERWLLQAQTGQLQELEHQVGELLKDPQGDEAEICEALVRGYRASKQFQRAKEIIDAWQADFHSDAQPHYWRGMLWLDTKFVDLAELEFRNALHMRPEHSDALFALAKLLQDRQAFVESLHTYRRFLFNKENDVGGTLGVVHCLRQLGRVEEAKSTLSRLSRDEKSTEIAF